MRAKLFRRLSGTIAAGLSVCLGSVAAAEETAPPALDIELNAIDTIGESCRLTFVLNNGLAEDIDKLVAETVLFSDADEVVLLTLFDFGALPVGRPRVRQFQVPERSCDRLGQVLVNGIDTCEIAGEDSGICQQTLGLSSRARIPMEG